MYLGEGCSGVRLRGVWSLDVCYLGALCQAEERELEMEVPGVMAMVQGKPSEHLSRGRLSTAGGKERAAAAGNAGETAACLDSTMTLQGFA